MFVHCLLFIQGCGGFPTPSPRPPCCQHDTLNAPSTAEEPGPELLRGRGQGRSTTRIFRGKALIHPWFLLLLYYEGQTEAVEGERQAKENKHLPSSTAAASTTALHLWCHLINIGYIVPHHRSFSPKYLLILLLML